MDNGFWTSIGTFISLRQTGQTILENYKMYDMDQTRALGLYVEVYRCIYKASVSRTLVLLTGTLSSFVSEISKMFENVYKETL